MFRIIRRPFRTHMCFMGSPAHARILIRIQQPVAIRMAEQARPAAIGHRHRLDAAAAGQARTIPEQRIEDQSFILVINMSDKTSCAAV